MVACRAAIDREFFCSVVFSRRTLIAGGTMEQTATDAVVRCAYHEAGHVVMHLVTQTPFDRVTLRLDGDAAGSATWNIGPSFYLNANLGNRSREVTALTRDAVLIYLAGAAAEVNAFWDYDEDGAVDDMANAYRYSYYLSSDPGRYTQSKFQEARRLLLQHWDWVCTLHDALLENRTLTRDEVVSRLGLAES